MQLSNLVSQEKWQEFDTAWKDSMADADLKDVLSALALAAGKKRIARCVPLAKEHANMLEADGQSENAARIIGATLVAGGHGPELSEQLARCVQAAYGEEDWWESCRALTGFDVVGADLRGPWKALSRFLAFSPGTLIIHPGGWGVGEILSRDDTAQEVEVRFHDGRKDNFPLRTAVDIFDPLQDEDLKARHFRDPEGLKKEVKKEPLDVLRRLTEIGGGTITTNNIKTALANIGIEGSAWSAWWRKARKLAENSEWFEVSGSAQKAIIRLLAEAKDPSVALRRQLQMSANLADTHRRVRDLLATAKPEDPLREIALEELAAAADKENEPLAERLAAWLLLRDCSGTSPEPLLPALEDMVNAEPTSDPSTAHPLWALFQELPSSKDQERAAHLLKELFNDAWMEHALENLAHAAPGMVRPLFDKLVKAGFRDDVREVYRGLLARPLRAPALLVTLASNFEKEELPDTFPTPPQRAQALLTLASQLYSGRRGNPHLTRVCTRLTDVLSKGTPSLVQRLLETSDPRALRGATLICSRGVDTDLDRAVTEAALSHDRHFFAINAGPFWEGKATWTTKIGLERRSAELHELTESKIPANEVTIGKAASYGDLSENAEWEAAMEEQRNLTQRAMDMEAELREVDLLENVALPEGEAAPGTLVKYRESNGREREVAILGPWDGDTWGGVQVVSYRAPLAAGLLGTKVGATADLSLPSGEEQVEVLSVEPLDLQSP